MPSCDWGRPCDCIECRTKIFSIICPACSFKNTVSYVREVEGYYTDRDGIGYYEFIEKSTPLKTLNCYKCKCLIKDVPYYEKIEEEINKRELNAKVCAICGIKDTEFMFPFKYKDGMLLCPKCFIIGKYGC
jgi:hypothetical protein